MHFLVSALLVFVVILVLIVVFMISYGIMEDFLLSDHSLRNAVIITAIIVVIVSLAASAIRW